MSQHKINELLDEIAFQADEITRKKIDEIKNHLLATGCWAFIKQRPYS